LHVGLTGGIGSGKSTVGQMLASFGATLIDADQISREVTSPGGAAMPEIAQTFGPQYINPHGALDRDRMRALAFSRPEARKQLEAIVHPLVGRETQARAQAATAAGQRLIVFDVPLLVESGHWPRKLDTVVVVDCPTETQIARVMVRSALEREAIEGIMASQASRNARRAAADVVVYNDNLSLDALQAQIHALAMWFGL
jgi:dephospho-CoA kinase